METDGETVGLMLLEGQGGQKLYRHLSCCVMTLNHFWGKSFQACIIIFLRAGSLQIFQNWPNKFKLVCDIEDAVSNVAVDINSSLPSSIHNNSENLQYLLEAQSLALTFFAFSGYKVSPAA